MDRSTWGLTPLLGGGGFRGPHQPHKYSKVLLTSYMVASRVFWLCFMYVLKVLPQQLYWYIISVSKECGKSKNSFYWHKITITFQKKFEFRFRELSKPEKENNKTCFFLCKWKYECFNVITNITLYTKTNICLLSSINSMSRHELKTLVKIIIWRFGNLLKEFESFLRSN